MNKRRTRRGQNEDTRGKTGGGRGDEEEEVKEEDEEEDKKRGGGQGVRKQGNRVFLYKNRSLHLPLNP